MLPNIFNYFSQENQSLSNFKGGLGVGLMLARALAELHGGSLTASSPGLGQGSEFILKLPIRTSKHGSKDASGTPNQKKKELKKQSILVVDDNITLADVFGKLLQSLNQTVAVAYSGASAIETVHTIKPDIIFIDIAMPGMSGYELVKKLRKSPSLTHTKLIAVSGFGDEYAERSQKAGFDGYLTKPVGISELTELFSA